MLSIILNIIVLSFHAVLKYSTGSLKHMNLADKPKLIILECSVFPPVDKNKVNNIENIHRKLHMCINIFKFDSVS